MELYILNYASVDGGSGARALLPQVIRICNAATYLRIVGATDSPGDSYAHVSLCCIQID